VIPAGVRLLSFDLDDTLWPCKPVIQRAERVVYDWLARHTPRITEALSLEAMWAQRKAFMAEHPELVHDLTEVRRRTLSALMVEFGYPVELAEEATGVFRQARNQVEPYPDVVPVLKKLRRRYLLVSVTNGNAQVEQTPLRGLFHLNLTSADVGRAKPHPALFEAAARWAGLAPEAMLHIGDDPERDILAARRAGLHQLWLTRRPGTPWPYLEHPPPPTLAHLGPLVEGEAPDA